MQAIVQDRYGPPELMLRLAEIDPPAALPGEVLIRVRAASVHPDVWHVVTGRPFILRLMGSGLRRPNRRVPGTDMAGTVEAAGRDVTRFQAGDEVFGETLAGHQWLNGGSFAEYVSVPEDCLALKPANLSFAEAAAVPTSGFIALHNLRNECRLRPGLKVLINGAAGGVGGLAHHILGSVPRMLRLTLRSLFDRNLPRPSFRMPAKREIMETLRDLLATGRLKAPPVDRAFPLAEAAQALAYLASGAARGRIVLEP